MNREIKFRAWDRKAQKWVINVCIDLEGHPFALHFHDDESGVGGEHAEVRDDLILMQFTGFLDKDGQEVYEGDILDYYGRRSAVIFDRGAFGCKTHLDKRSLPTRIVPLSGLNLKYATVTGNIYANSHHVEAAS